MELPFAVKIIQPFEHLAQYHRDMHFLEVTGLHQVQGRAAAQVLHDNP